MEISSSSSESEEQTAAEEVASDKKRRLHALKMAELFPKTPRFLATTRSFHTRAHSLERSTTAVSSSTYAKAEERMLCKYFGPLENSSFVCLFVCLELAFSLLPFRLSGFQAFWVTPKTDTDGPNL